MFVRFARLGVSRLLLVAISPCCCCCSSSLERELELRWATPPRTSDADDVVLLWKRQWRRRRRCRSRACLPSGWMPKSQFASELDPGGSCATSRAMRPCIRGNIRRNQTKSSTRSPACNSKSITIFIWSYLFSISRISRIDRGGVTCDFPLEELCIWIRKAKKETQNEIECCQRSTR